MARKRARSTIEMLRDAVMRLGLPPRSVDMEALQAHLRLPEFGGEVEDSVVARALREMKARRAFAETGAPALRQAFPALKFAATRDGTLHWLVRVPIPLLDGGRLDLRIDASPEGAVAGILAGMAHRNDPAWRRDELRAGLAEIAAQTTRALRRPVEYSP